MQYEALDNRQPAVCVPEKFSLAMLFLALRSVVSSRPVPLASWRHPVLQGRDQHRLLSMGKVGLKVKASAASAAIHTYLY